MDKRMSAYTTQYISREEAISKIIQRVVTLEDYRLNAVMWNLFADNDLVEYIVGYNGETTDE
jgi:hypothetical protein